ncbi:MAG: dihydroorotase [Bacteroidetes bacterium]|nr:dihydroorotase [Bacteroidota bacterium]
MEKNITSRSSGSILIKNGKIISAGSPFNKKTTDILLKNGKIEKIGKIKTKCDLEIDALNCIITTGLFDLRCKQGEPGEEQNEDINSLINTAVSGGFTGVATLPDINPAIQTKAQIEFLLRKSENKIVDISPLGALTVNCEGKELSEMYEMHAGGAIGFSNGNNPVNYGTLQRALLYVKDFDGLIFSHAEDKNLSNNGTVNESKNTVSLGLKFFPDIAEFTQVASQIEIAKYTDSKIHFSHLSSAKSVELIRKAKSEKIKVTSDVSILHLIYTDEIMQNFDSNLKIMPPLRNETDRQALIDGINDGTIDCIISDHNPHSPETKLVEFNFSPFGAITLQILYSLYNQFLSDKIDIDTFIKVASINPRKILNLPLPQINEKMPANLVVFNTDENWEFNKQSNHSLSTNSHFLGKTLKGKCVFVANNNFIRKL